MLVRRSKREKRVSCAISSFEHTFFSYIFAKSFFSGEAVLLLLRSLRFILVIIHEAGFQTVAIFMQSGSSEKPKAGGDSISEVVISDFVEDSPHKVCM